MGIVAKYKFDGSVYADLIPEFNAEFTDYTITDEVDSENSNHIIRTIESDSLPTLIKFGNATETPNSRSLLTVEYLDTSECTTLEYLCAWCVNLSEFNCNLDTGKAKGAYSCFHACYNLSVLNVNSWDTTNFTGYGVFGIFAYCEKLSELDLSNWILDDCAIFARLFEDNKSLTRLDISNLNLNNATNVTSMFGGNIDNLTDIGMIYCDQSTINKVASLLPTNHNITIWVESDDILQYDQYDHITYKTQKVQDTVHLNSPLLVGDTIEVIDGKTYHVHRSKKKIIDGINNGWWDTITIKDGISVRWQLYYDISDIIKIDGSVDPKGYLECDGFPVITGDYSWGGGLGVCISSGLCFSHEDYRTQDKKEDFLNWLSENPVSVVYRLTTPYYELISEEPLELTLLDTTDNTINNNSILPSNMTIANKELSTIAIKPSTTYTLSFDKSNVDSEVTIDICGGEQITTVLNRIELTTPSELGSGIRFISSDGCIISNVRLLEGSLVKEAIPKETFEGLKSSFEDGYIIGENLVPIGVNYQSDVISKATQLKKTIPAGTTITIIIHTKQACKSCVRACLQLQDKDGAGSQISYVGAVNNADFAINTGYHMSTVRTLTHDLSYINVWFNQVEGIVEYDEIYILEGDHTHLSEAELMRYIEKGTSHYEEEDYNHVGKYKVQYKVTGKNKAKYDLVYDMKHSEGSYVCSRGYASINNVTPLEKGVYSFSIDGYDLNKFSDANILVWKSDSTYETVRRIMFGNPIEIKDDEIGITWYGAEKFGDISTLVGLHFQIEEGTVATEYEPYKEDIKTYYLSSPLLEGDTIEDINGVATHVKRYDKVVLDGSEDEKYTVYRDNDVCKSVVINHYPITPKEATGICNNFLENSGKVYNGLGDGIWTNSTTSRLYISITKQRLGSLTFKQWFQQNPTTVVYQLASPKYEPISTEPILCDSYVNGHLDLSNENIPIQKTEFRNFVKELAYLQPSTDYVVKFSSDNIGTAKVYLDSSVKEINVVKGINEAIITTPSTIVNNNIIIDGIGFNVSDVQVVANAIKDGDIKDFDYFKGLKSSFESELVTDENDENYGKYKVECKIVGKNKFDGVWEFGDINWDNGNYSNSTSSIRSINFMKVKEGQNLSFNYKSSENLAIRMYDKDKKYLGATNLFSNTNKIYSGDTRQIPKGVCYMKTKINSTDINFQLQIEEGTQATSYEPYKESIHTLYLNSPLLKGDKLVVHDGKLCHYHKMGQVVLDGSEDWFQSTHKYTTVEAFFMSLNNYIGSNPLISDKFIQNGFSIDSEGITNNYNNVEIGIPTSNKNVIRIKINKTKLSTINATGFKQWLQANPTTVVHELTEPYYEPIEPQLSQYSFSTVKDGDMEIITALPIEKINLTYRTDINGVSSIEEQIASIQEGTDISSIIDEEVDE